MVELSLSQITTINRSLWERLGEHAQEGDEVRGAAAAQPVHPSDRWSIAPKMVTCRFLPGVRIFGRAPRSVQLARTCGSRCRWVSSSAHTTARRRHGAGPPTMFQIGRADNTDAVLAPLLTRFARWSVARAALQTATLIVVAIAVAVAPNR